jgi:hypothetical protein
MLSKIISLDRRTIVRTAKTMLYIVPIVGITNNIYISIYDVYELDFSGFVHFAEGNMTKLAIAFLIFSTILLFAFFVEQFVIPLIFILTNKTKFELDEEQKEQVQQGYKKIYSIDFFKVKGEPLFKFELIADITFLFTVPILWLIFWNHWMGYIIMILPVALLILLARLTVIVLELDVDVQKKPAENQKKDN